MWQRHSLLHIVWGNVMMWISSFLHVKMFYHPFLWWHSCHKPKNRTEIGLKVKATQTGSERFQGRMIVCDKLIHLASSVWNLRKTCKCANIQIVLYAVIANKSSIISHHEIWRFNFSKFYVSNRTVAKLALPWSHLLFNQYYYIDLFNQNIPASMYELKVGCTQDP